MALIKTYWTVKGISPEARNAALRAANASGEELGVWLSRLINKVSVAERNAVSAANDRAADVSAAENGTTGGSAEADTGDKLSSIERAMRQSRAGGDSGSA